MTVNPADLLTTWIERAREVAASTGSLHESVGTLVLELEENQGRGATVAALALLQLAADEDYSGVTR